MRLLLIACLLSAAPIAWAGELLIESAPTFELPGYVTYTLSIEPEGGEAFRGVEASFSGPMNQALLIGSQEVVFSELRSPCLGCNSAFAEIANQDSHFLFESPRDGTPILLLGEESDDSLTGQIAGLQFYGLPPGPTPFAQIVADQFAQVDYELDFDLGTGDFVSFNGFLSTPSLPGDCEPDGDVDIIDFGIFADAYRSNDPTGPCSDFDDDGDVDIIDFGLFADNFGLGAVAVPEPTTAVSVLTMLLATAATRRHQ